MSLGFRDKTIYVYGLGRSGQAAIHALLEDGAHVWAWDDRENTLSADLNSSTNLLRVAPEEVDWSQVSAVLKSPGIDADRPLLQTAVQHSIPILGDIDLLYRCAPSASYIGITGTNGKSTTTALVTHVLRCAGHNVVAGGNIGQPALSLPILEKDDIYVLELSSYQLDLMAETKLDAATLLNISPDHLERYNGMSGYLASKMHIFDCCKESATKVIGVDHPLLQTAAQQNTKDSVETLTISGQQANYRVTQQGKLMHKGKQIADLSYFDNLAGPHNWQNLVAALLICAPWMSKDDFFKHARTFVGLPHRMERVQELEDIIFINDSKATNPESAIAALQSYKNIYWIVGGRAKAEGIAPCLEHTSNVRAAFTIGEAQQNFAEVLEEKMPVFCCESLDIAVREAYAAARQEGLEDATVLLSPACASFDQYDSFEQRGDAFAVLCRQLQIGFHTERDVSA
ncbi:MAG: UDP-N-acetylmuramoyl-L-alanine--D-glutamate ligase [Alphaproteobacteria bacterium]|nr:UDP-N-acetylmuramoyl-L-alanine--D-glutamate ligase [Alphaproteobacteria bacterium]MDD9919638.1 UDP-N-acetylmuramoyl-L-alanine--D-glutamate ligase [Alphaproteobacteria bacterium]